MANSNSTNISPSTAFLTQLKPTHTRIWSSCEDPEVLRLLGLQPAV